METRGDRQPAEAPYSERRRRLLALALDALVFDTDVVALEDLLWLICEETTWAGVAHFALEVGADYYDPSGVVDLFAADTALALAETLSLLGNRLHPRVQGRVRAEVARRIFQPVFGDTTFYWWEAAEMNWAAVCAGCVGVTALILEDDRERLCGMIDRVLNRALASFLAGYGDDGACPEGMTYWNYGFGHFVYFADALRVFTAGALDPLRDGGPKLERIARFPAHVTLAPGRVVNFSDSFESASARAGLATRLAERLGVPIPPVTMPSFHSDRFYRWTVHLRELTWVGAEPSKGDLAPACTFFPDVQWVVDRFSVDGTALAFAAKGGHNDEPHNHNDLGHFILFVGDESLLADLGAGRYTRDYFWGDRYAHLHPSSRGHSVPVINGGEQHASRRCAARVLSFEERGDGLTFALNLTGAYEESGLTRFTRRFDLTREPNGLRLYLTDDFALEGAEGLVEEAFVSLLAPHVSPGVVRWAGRWGDVALDIPENLTVQVQPIPSQAHDGVPITVHRLTLRRRIGRAARVRLRFDVTVTKEDRACT